MTQVERLTLSALPLWEGLQRLESAGKVVMAVRQQGLRHSPLQPHAFIQGRAPECLGASSHF